MSERTLATLNLAQQGTVCLGLLCAMLAAARRVAAGAMSVGDFVMVNAFVLQLIAPLTWLGTIYRWCRTRSSTRNGCSSCSTRRPK